VPQLYSRLGGEFLVNTTTAGNQGAGRLVPLSDGGFIAFWTSPDADLFGIFGQRFDAAGAKVGAEFAVNATTAGDQQLTNAVRLASGNVMVAWWDESKVDGDASPGDYRGQIFDASGAPVGGEVHLASPPGASAAQLRGVPALGALPGGGFVLAWTQDDPAGPDTSSVSVKAQIFTAAGTPTGAQIAVNSTTTGPQYAPSLAVLASGDFVVTWNDLSTTLDTSQNGIFGQRFDSAGNKLGGEFLVNTNTVDQQLSSSVTALAGGGFVVTWNDGLVASAPGAPLPPRSVKAQIYDSAGVRVGGEIAIAGGDGVDRSGARIVALADGSFLATWTSAAGSNDARGQFFDASGNRLGSEFSVSETVAGSQVPGQSILLANGTIVSIWTDSSGVGGDSAGSAIKAQLFSVAGPPTDLSLSTSTVLETATVNEAAATFSAVGALNARFTYTIVSDSTGGAFRIEGDKLVVADNLRLDFETRTTETIRVRVTDDAGLSYEETLTLDIADMLLERRFVAGDVERANATGAGYQSGTPVALAGGGFVVVYVHFDPSQPAGQTLGRIFAADGSPVGNAFTVASTGLFEFIVKPLSGGGFVVANEFFNTATGRSEIVARLFNGAGAQVDTIAMASATSHYGSPSIAQLSEGGYVMSFSSWPEEDVLAQRFDSDGAPVGATFTVNSTTTGLQTSSEVIALDAGRFAIAWRDLAVDDSIALKLQIFGADGTPEGGEKTLIPAGTETEEVSILRLTGGGFVVAWFEWVGSEGSLNGYVLRIQLADAAGDLIGVPIDHIGLIAEEDSEYPPSLGALADGGFVVSWGALDPETGLAVRSTFAQVFDSAGNAAGPQLRPALAGEQPGVAVLTGGDLVFGWTAAPESGQDSDAWFRVYRPNDPTDGTPARDVMTGTPAADRYRGLDGNDSLRLQQGGDDSAYGGAGNDSFYFGAAYTAADLIDGGTERDQVALQGNYNLTLGSITAVEDLILLSGSDTRFGDIAGNLYTYVLTSIDANVAAGAKLLIDATMLVAGESLTFDGTAETDGKFLFSGSQGTDIFTGGAGADGFYFRDGSFWNPGDKVIGGAGDQIGLRGDFTGAQKIVMGADQIQGVETIVLMSGVDIRFGPIVPPTKFDITMHDGNLASGRRFTVDASQLAANETARVDASAETDGTYRMFGGAGADELIGGANADFLRGGLGADILKGNNGADTFAYRSAAESTSTGFDLLVDVKSAEDRIDLHSAVSGWATSVTSGQLSHSSFDADLAAALDAALGPNQAILFDPTSGDYAGRHFLVVDADGDGAYTAGADYVFELGNAAVIDTSGTGIFA
jgi:Ca2+-binding RTX toxin-like protein